MWPDNETDVDLVGFDYLVDQLEVLLTDSRLLPLTVLVSGDWGSGKSSLMQVAQKRLENDANRDKFICVSFTPWRFEDFNYGKVALMAAVVDAIAEYADEHEGAFNRTKKMSLKLRKTLHRWGVWKHAASVGAIAAGADPALAAVAASAADAAGASLDADDEQTRTFETVAHFHTEFAELVESLGDEVQAVVVFIDDMDRCSSTDTIVETFEAMRLFLNAPKTAYVVGAQENIVEASLDTRYQGRHEADDELGRRWLEKMLYHPIKVPPLGEPEVLSYINLLFAELYTTPAEFAQLRAKAEQNRTTNPFQVAMNQGIAQDTVGDLLPELIEGLEIAAQVGPLMAQNLRGNPRETKRFLNRFLLRMATADKRKMALDAAKLAKLMVLEVLMDDQKHFERVFKWQLEADTGAPDEMVLAERFARTKKSQGVPSDIRDWVAQPRVGNWLRLEPSLAGINLAPYFMFSRDRLATLITAPRLTVELQRVLAALQDAEVPPLRVKAVQDMLKLDHDARAELLPGLLDAAQQNLSGAAAESLRELAKARTDVATAMFEMLGRLPISKAKGNFAIDLGTDFRGDARTRPLLERWAGAPKASSDLKRQAERALAKL